MLKKELGSGAGAEAAKLLGKVEDSVKRMDLLIADLLAFSRMGRAEMRSCRVDLARLLSQVKEELSEDIRGRSVAWNTGELPEVEGDPDLLRQVLANLVGNAVKFTRKQPQAAIEGGAAPVKDGRAVIYVRDNGAGFDMAYAERLFGLFQRLHLQEDYEGTGIGLANVRRIIKRHGGEVWAESAPGKGATFYFTLALPAKAR